MVNPKIKFVLVPQEIFLKVRLRLKREDNEFFHPTTYDKKPTTSLVADVSGFWGSFVP